MIINAENLVVGRIATISAKKALNGEKIDIVNCEKAILTGSRANIFAKYRRKISLGVPLKGPYFPRRADMMVRRIIRGMLPYKNERGRNAFKRIMCYIGVPDKLKDQKMETIEDANVKKLTNLKYVTIKEVSEHIGAKK